MELSADRLASQVAKEPLRPAYLIAGNEPLLVLEAADAVRAAARAQGIGEREVHDMEGRDADWGALDAAILHEFLRHNELPPNLPGLSGGCAEIILPDHATRLNGRTILKISVGMGGRNALIAMKPHLPS